MVTWGYCDGVIVLWMSSCLFLAWHLACQFSSFFSFLYLNLTADCIDLGLGSLCWKSLLDPPWSALWPKVLDLIEVPLAKESAESVVLFGEKGSGGRPDFYPALSLSLSKSNRWPYRPWFWESLLEELVGPAWVCTLTKSIRSNRGSFAQRVCWKMLYCLELRCNGNPVGVQGQRGDRKIQGRQKMCCDRESNPGLRNWPPAP